ncbi:MAG: SpoIIE family protein phosphatase, partial [Acidobacteriota bacterium]|nr:SpoIIE family protein phosphatase [Acidobacteriota bacterium]
WRENLRKTREYYRRAFELALDAGDQAYAGYAGFFLIGDEIMAGYPLQDIYQEAKALIPFYKRTNVAVLDFIFTPSNLVPLSKLMAAPLTEMGVEAFDEEDFLEKSADNNLFLCWYYYAQIRDLYLFRQFEDGVAMLETVALIESNLPGHVKTAEIYFYMALHHLAFYDQVDDPEQRASLLERARGFRDKMADWALSCPANFSHKHLVMNAEIDRVEGRFLEAMKGFEQAAVEAGEAGFVQNQAIAFELAGRLQDSLGFSKPAVTYYKEAYYHFHLWGASGKCHALIKTHPELSTSYAAKDPFRSISTMSTHSDVWDMDIAYKAAHAFSREVVLPDLLKKIMRFILENSGAQQGYLITLDENKRHVIQAEGHIDDSRVAVLEGRAIEEYPSISAKIVRFVFRTSKDVVLDDILKSNWLSDDFKGGNVQRSVICSPLLSRGRIQAAFYLNNSLVSGAFTPERLELIRFLSSQMAIALENAQVYANLERTVAQRTRELSKKNRQIMDSIQYAERIQKAILPGTHRIEEYLPDVFILFKPRDIVSGDFYWLGNNERYIFFAAVDCTGHGVPGAFMSMISNTLLNQSVNDRKLEDPAEILTDLNAEVVKTLHQSKRFSTDDGMDMVLCRFDRDLGNLLFAGANRPLYLVPSGSDSLKVFKGTRRSIGGRQKRGHNRFVNQEIDWKPGDMIYLSSDGFSDQSGRRNRKFGSSALKALLGSIASKPVGEQKRRLESELELHQGDIPQRDDILLVGIRHKKPQE